MGIAPLPDPLYTFACFSPPSTHFRLHFRPFFDGGGLRDRDTESLYLLRFAPTGLLESLPRSPGELLLRDLFGGGLGDLDIESSRRATLARGGGETLATSRARGGGERLSLDPRRSTGERDRESYDDARLGERLGERLA
ncbi:hypothetical protein ColLi_09300 [Colletotrichum liriopes]|uniref:Uncharacterized protein n=1 Tax=Colletotrichum liriopes TaxID=708192 RepID=A0AA37GU05_9PEZI|nr:hypothetical protein ColLi_09300 [Colletotrichum liriopes]